jgi:hypothetical protein
VASKPAGEAHQYNAIGIRRASSNEYRIHAYPNFAYFGIETADLFGQTPKHRHGHGYETVWVGQDHAREFINKLLHKRGVVVAPESEMMPVMQRGFDPSSDAEDSTEPLVESDADWD